MNRRLIVAQIPFLPCGLLSVDRLQLLAPWRVEIRSELARRRAPQLPENGLRITGEADIEPLGSVYLGGIHVDADDLCVCAEARRAQIPEHIVDAGANDQQDVGFLERSRARVRIAQFMVLRHDTAALRRSEER